MLPGLSIGRNATSHTFVRECLEGVALMRRERSRTGRVIGTENTRRPELYGWANPVEPHMDNVQGDRYVYGMLLRGRCEIFCLDPEYGHQYSYHLTPGAIFRLNDRLPHWTRGRTDSACIFVGCWPEPQDETAFELLARGLRRLESGTPTAPRVAPGARALPGYVWIYNFRTNSPLHVRQAVAARIERAGDNTWWLLATCAKCDKPAVTLDHHFPIYQDGNTCGGCQ
jgi:hypothetical protein